MSRKRDSDFDLFRSRYQRTVRERYEQGEIEIENPDDPLEFYTLDGKERLRRRPTVTVFSRGNVTVRISGSKVEIQTTKRLRIK